MTFPYNPLHIVAVIGFLLAMGSTGWTAFRLNVSSVDKWALTLAASFAAVAFFLLHKPWMGLSLVYTLAGLVYVGWRFRGRLTRRGSLLAVGLTVLAVGLGAWFYFTVPNSACAFCVKEL